VLGVGVRIGDPALPLLSSDAQLDANACGKLQVDVLKRLPDALADADSPNARDWLLQRWLPAVVLGAALGLGVARYSSSSRRSTPVSSTARRFLR
jgi:ABC-type enterobactin transport system permease subunit